MKARIEKIARQLLGLPTAPFREHRVRDCIRDFCRTRGIATRTDDMGNVIATVGKTAGLPVLAFAAHMDHPGFIIEKDSKGRRTTALFYGGVEEEYFKGGRIRVFTENGEVRGRITSTTFDRKKRIKRVHLALEGDVRRGEVAMWDLPACRIRGDRLTSRACDDVVGCVSVLALLDELARRRPEGKVLGVFTVGEEAGANGAKYLAITKGIPRKARIFAIETSREMPSARIGNGVVIRVGDRARIFDPTLTRFAEHVAAGLAKRRGTFRFKRALMDGGTCEASVYQAFGYTCGAFCIPLGNYHNRDFKRKKIAAECISLDDLTNMVKLFVGLCEQAGELDALRVEAPPTYTEERRELGERLFR